MTTARAVRSAWLAALPDEASDALARLALDLAEERDTLAELLRAALDQLCVASEQRDRLKATVRELLADRRREAA